MPETALAVIPAAPLALKEAEVIQAKLLKLPEGFKNTRYGRDSTGPNRFNSGKSFTFVREENLLLGSFGWRPKQIPNFDPVPANMVLHDMWEHTPGSPATPEEEFQAIGTAFYVRHEGGYYSSLNVRTSDELPKAFRMLYYHAAVRDQRPTAPCPLVPIATVPLRRQDTEMEMIRTVAVAHDLLSSDRIFTKAMPLITDSLQHALPWMRVGYRKAQLRFDGLNMRRLSDTYRQASNKIQEFLNLNAADGELVIVGRPEKYHVDVRYQRNIEFQG